MGKPAWTDYTIYGKALKAIFFHMNTKYWHCDDPELQHAYLDRMLKCTERIESLTDKVLGVNKLIKEGTKLEQHALIQ